MRFAFLFITLVVASTFAAVQNIQGSYQSKAGGQRKQNVFQSYSTNFSCFLRKLVGCLSDSQNVGIVVFFLP